jgi:hypothetical protein
MLNILCRYVGFADWNDFREKNKTQLPTNKLIISSKKRKKYKIAFTIMLCIALILLFFLFKPKEYTFCFFDADQRSQLTNQEIEIIILNDGESPIYKKCFNGCFTIKSSKTKIRFVVKSPYYKIDTITRILNSRDRNERVQLHTNDYALMIHFFSKSKLNDWKRRREQLSYMFADNAQIYQLYDDKNIGIELYNKTEFINKLTMPLRSLQNIEIIESIYIGNQISILKFRQIQKP